MFYSLFSIFVAIQKEDGAECEQVISFGGASDMDGDVDNELYVGNNKNSNARGAAGSHSSNKKRFEMDRVFQPSHSQEKVKTKLKNYTHLFTFILSVSGSCVFFEKGFVSLLALELLMI